MRAFAVALLLPVLGAALSAASAPPRAPARARWTMSANNLPSPDKRSSPVAPGYRSSTRGPPKRVEPLSSADSMPMSADPPPLALPKVDPRFLRYAEKMNGRVAMFFFSFGVYREFVSGESLPRQLFDFLGGGHHA